MSFAMNNPLMCLDQEKRSKVLDCVEKLCSRIEDEILIR